MAYISTYLTVFTSRPFWNDRMVHLHAVAKWSLLLLPMGMLVGSFCALFLWALDAVTALRFAHPWLLFGLPVGGFLIGLAYLHKGKGSDGGNNLLVEQIHEPGGGVPLRMAPFVLIATVATHLFGGSVGREGTAVQLGGSIASGVARAARLDAAGMRILMMAGIAAGFGAVFGTPVAGAIFALEVLTIGRIQYDALMPCLAAALIGDWVCRAWGIEHTHYIVHTHLAAGLLGVQPVLLAKAAIGGVLFGLCGLVFAEFQHRLSDQFKARIAYAPLRPVVGGLAVIALVYLLGTRDYLGLGIWSADPHAVTLPAFFEAGRVDHWSWLLKMLFTVVALASGFKGGEVTPLFFIGAALGNALASVLHAPVDLFAALGFVGLFAGASNTPLACTIMGVELFGGEYTAYLAVACFVAYLCSGHSGIYLSQRVGIPKNSANRFPANIPLRQARQMILRPRPVDLSPLPIAKELPSMPMSHTVTANEVGMIRIYFRPGDRVQGGRMRAIFRPRAVYRQIVQEAKASGVMNAVAHHAHYGYSNHGRVQDMVGEMPNPDMTVCVELIAARRELENFCRTHGALLAGKVVIYKHLEHWRIAPGLEEAAIA